MKKELFSKGNAVVGIIGQGYVGLPLALLFAESKIRVIGFDVDQTKVDVLNKGKSFIEYIPSERIKNARKAGFYKATADMKRLDEPDAIIVCVPTPLDHHLQPDVSFITRSAQSIAKRLRPGQLIVLESTSYPGCTRQDVLPALEATGLKIDRDFAVAFSPEREDPSNKSFSTHNIPKLVGGLTDLGGELAFSLYSRVIKTVIKVDSAEVAESSKLLENIFRSVNIALVNEMARLCDRMGGIDIWEVVDAAATKPFGFMPFYPGPGIGGHCILVDPYYLAWKAREFDFHTKFIELAAESNEDMPFYVVGNIRRALGNVNSSLQNGKILMLGVSFKKDIDDRRNSPALRIMELLLQRGVKELNYNDPYIPEVKVGNKKFKSLPLTKEILENHDVVVITADHSQYDAQFIVDNSKAIVDTRNLTKNIKNDLHKIVKLGSGRGFYTDIFNSEK